MRRLLYLSVLLLVPLLILAPSARAQDKTAEEAEENAPAPIIFSGNGQTVTDSFNLAPRLVIVTVCGGISVSDTNEVTDAGPEANVGGVVEAKAGGAEARVSEAGAEARAGG